MPPAFVERRSSDSYGRVSTNYQVWLPGEDQLGLVETRPLYYWEAASNSHYRQYSEQIERLTETGMGDVLAEAGFTVVRESLPEHRADTLWLTYPSLQELIGYSDKRAEAAGPEAVPLRFKEYDGGIFTAIEFLTNLRDGFVLVSNSLADYLEHTDGNFSVKENHPRFLHDILAHVPAWLCLPPAITAELQAAAGAILAERQAALADPDRLEAIDKRMKRMSGLIDGAIANVFSIQGPINDPKPQNFANYLGEVTGRQSIEDQRRYTRLVKEYVARPQRVGRAAKHAGLLALRRSQLLQAA
jgi:hypothetical protein